MKKRLLYLGMMAVTMGLVTTNAVAQDTSEAGEAVTYSLPAMRILDLEGVAPTLTFAVPLEAGTAIVDVTSSTSWINYTSIVATATTNKVSVAITGIVPAGTTLKVVAAAHAGTGNGTYGTPKAAAVILSSTAQDLITTIGSCFTGTGFTNGHQLTYTWSVNPASYATVVAAAGAAITATYTILATGI